MTGRCVGSMIRGRLRGGGGWGIMWGGIRVMIEVGRVIVLLLMRGLSMSNSSNRHTKDLTTSINNSHNNATTIPSPEYYPSATTLPPPPPAISTTRRPTTSPRTATAPARSNTTPKSTPMYQPTIMITTRGTINMIAWLRMVIRWCKESGGRIIVRRRRWGRRRRIVIA